MTHTAATERERISILKNKLERATTRHDPTGQICAALCAEIAALEAER